MSVPLLPAAKRTTSSPVERAVCHLYPFISINIDLHKCGTLNHQVAFPFFLKQTSMQMEEVRVPVRFLLDLFFAVISRFQNCAKGRTLHLHEGTEPPHHQACFSTIYFSNTCHNNSTYGTMYLVHVHQYKKLHGSLLCMTSTKCVEGMSYQLQPL